MTRRAEIQFHYVPAGDSVVCFDKHTGAMLLVLKSELRVNSLESIQLHTLLLKSVTCNGKQCSRLRVTAQNMVITIVG